MKAYRTVGDLRVGHVITYGTVRLTVTSVVPAGEGRREVSGTYAKRGQLKRVGATFRAGVLRDVWIHNWDPLDTPNARGL